MNEIARVMMIKAIFDQRAYGMCTIMNAQQYLALLNEKFGKRKTK